MKHTYLLLILLSTLTAFSQNIPEHLTTNWEIAGYEGDIPCHSNLRNAVDEFGIDNTGATDVSSAVESALFAIADNDVLYFPNGTYLFNKTIAVPSNRVIRGESPSETRLLFDLQADANMIDVSGSAGTETSITSIQAFGGNELVVSDASSFAVGDDIEIEQENDPAVHYTDENWNKSWAQQIKGQIVKISAISGNTITVDRSFTFDYNTDFSMTMRKINAKTNVGFENFYIERVDANTGLTNNNFLLYYVNNCWIRKVHSYFTARYHVRMERSRNIEVRECEIEMADDCGGGGAGYGVLAQKHTEDCLIEDNIFHDIRHPLIVKEGVTRNVYAYNYCFDIRNNATCDSDPANPYADISLHGHYPAYNLFEGNIVGRISSTDYWGPAGPGNTFFRNRVNTEKGVWTQEYSHEQVFVGNELISPADMFDNRDGTVDGTVLVANTVQGTVDNAPVETVKNSLFHSAKPEFFGNLAWPAMGYGTDIGNGVIPAQQRWLDGQPFTAAKVCSACKTPDLGVENNLCGVESIEFNTNLSSTNRIFTWFKDDVEIEGEETPDYIVTAPGTYKVIVDSLGCITESEIAIVDYPLVNLPSDFTLCSPSMVQLDAENASLPNVTYLWSTGETTQMIDVIAGGTYSVTVSADGCGSGSDEVAVQSELIDVTGDELTEAGTAFLQINESGNYNWYAQAEGGTPIHEGATYEPEVTESTYFWVENANGLEFSIGNESSTLSNGYYNDDYTASRYFFDVLYPITLNSITVYADKAQTVVITVENSAGDIVGAVSQDVDAGEQIINLDIVLPEGNNYAIHSEGTTGKLWRDKEAGAWEYVEAGYLSIHSTEPTWIENNGYYAFWYNWKCTAGNPCERTPVLAKVASSVELETQEIVLKKGWNLVSLYILPNDCKDGQSCVSTVFPNAEIVKTFDSFYSSSQLDYLNSLSELKTGEGYLVYNSIDEVVTVSGTQGAIDSPALKDGWSLIGAMQDVSAEEFVSEINATIIKNFEGFYEVGNTLNSLTELKAGKAYFVKK